jgi:hypothetical protein
MYDLLDRSPCELRGEPRLILMSLRLWVRAIKEGSCPLRGIEPVLTRFVATNALWPLHNYFYWTAAHATRKLLVECCARGAVSEDEALMITAIRSTSSADAVEHSLKALVEPEALCSAIHLASIAQAELGRAVSSPRLN